jgi:hypothetical protein
VKNNVRRKGDIFSRRKTLKPRYEAPNGIISNYPSM